MLAQTGAVMPVQQLTAGIKGPGDIAVGRTIVLDASTSTGLGEDTEYRWYRDGLPQPISRSVEAVLTPERPGSFVIRLVVQTVINGETVEAETERMITVYSRKIILVADSGISEEKLMLHADSATEAGIYMPVLQPASSSIPLALEDSLFSLLAENTDTLAGAESVILWTDGIKGLQAVMRAAEADPELAQGIRSQNIIILSDGGLGTLARTARGPFTVLQPARILITRKEAMNPLVTTTDVNAFLAEVEKRDIDLVIVDQSTAALRPWNLLTSLVNYMLTTGIPSQTVILLLMLPVIAMILAFLKQVVGITSFGLYTPSIVALSFIALGWWVGLLFLLFILITGYVTRMAMKRWRLLYIPKVAIILTVVSLTLLLLLGLGAFLGLPLTSISRDTIFILLIMSTLSESFLNMKAEGGWWGAFVGMGETILAALLCVFIVQWSTLQSLVLAYPEIVLLTIAVDIFLGRWTGLRLVEYFRFREVFKHLQEEE